LPDGRVVIDGNVVYIGRTGGAGDGPGGSEPYIKFSEYKSWLTELGNVLTTLLNSLSTNFVVPSPPIVGGVHPGLAVAAADVATAIADVGVLISKIDDVKSERIFGE